MNRPEIDAIAEAVMRPDARRLRIAARHRQAAHRQRRQRVAVGASLIGMVAGLLLAPITGLPWVQGMIAGGALALLAAHPWLQRREGRG
ncbi:hypothetical protein ACJ7C5_08475 [Nocardiopsis yanglingensis]